MKAGDQKLVSVRLEAWAGICVAEQPISEDIEKLALLGLYGGGRGTGIEPSPRSPEQSMGASGPLGSEAPCPAQPPRSGKKSAEIVRQPAAGGPGMLGGSSHG